ncbi:hypothetical protein Csa_008338 [Cucumis sativus]|uniref:Uncharacterized protein n=1 Tax=Cucumis sativus TaxID=3659 RepID=A0A0A0KPV7_CUCSA|nr:hypothetical protein Csa_008338 [Cucumis sativus]
MSAIELRHMLKKLLRHCPKVDDGSLLSWVVLDHWPVCEGPNHFLLLLFDCISSSVIRHYASLQ